VRSNVLQPAAAAFAVACIAVPACVPAAQVAAHSAVAAIENHSVALPVALSASTTDLLNALGLFVEVPLWIAAANPAGGPTATNVPPLPAALKPGGLYNIASYSSVYTVVNAAIKVISAPAVDITTGQWGTAITDTQKAVTAFQTALTNLPPSVIATLQYAISQLTTALGVSTAAATPKSAATMSALAAAPSATPTAASLLNTLGLLVQVPLWIATANPTGAATTVNGIPPLPAALLPEGAYGIQSYASIYTVINAAVKILSAPAVDITTGQFGNIQTDTQNAITAFQTSVTNLQRSVTATLKYAAGQVEATAGVSAAASTKLQSAAAITPASTESDTVDVPAVNIAKPKALTAAASTTAAPHGGFLHNLQNAVDKQVGGGTVHSTDSSHSGASAAPDSSSTGTPKAAQHHAAKAAAAGAKSAGKGK
jgi:hypothetical protein